MAKKKAKPAKPTKRALRRPSRDGNGSARKSKPAAQRAGQDGKKLPLPPHAREKAAASTAAAEPSWPEFTIVGIGASAGGLDAISQVLGGLPVDCGLAVVIVQHMSAEHESLLPELLADTTNLPVVHVADGSDVEPNRVYVTVPGVQIAIDHGAFRLIPRPQSAAQFLPIDAFFRALAEYAGPRAVGVVLSGNASDGAMGLREIKAAGGITIAQEPRSAKFEGMPRAAIASGSVDLTLAPRQIAEELVRISHHPLVRAAPTEQPQQPQQMDDENMFRIYTLLRGASGIDFTHYKTPTIRRRLQRRMVLHKIDSIEQYLQFLQRNPAELEMLQRDMLIHVTRFFREQESFDVLKQVVFARLVGLREHETPIRIWIPGCSTGEEAYSVAIALLEYLGDAAPGTPAQIFATDVSESAVEHARQGYYSENIAGDVSAERLRRFFTKTDGRYRIGKTVRDLCIFARQDLTRDPPFSRLDLIVCRNVMIYLGQVLQKRLIHLFHYALKPHRYLMLGSAESIGAHADLFAMAEKRHKLYMKKPGMPHADLGPMPPGEHRNQASRRAIAANDARNSGEVQHEANRVVLSRYSPPAVIVDNELQIVQFRGQTGAFLEPAPGQASLNLLKMVREGLLYGLRDALHHARKNDAAVVREGLRVQHNGGLLEVRLEVVPLNTPSGRHFLVVFQEGTKGAAAPSAPVNGGRKPAPAAERGKRRRGAKKSDPEGLARLEQELAASRDYMQAIIQDLEAANEELQSANEEILSSNEELQSTNEELDTAKEELQSTNEELNTVNEELQGRNEELSRVNSDLVNLLASVQIAIVIVASDLRIRRFTPMAEKVLNLIPSDVGRPITDIHPNFDFPDIEAWIGEAIESVSTREREVHDRNGAWYQLRIRPYKNVEDRIDGAVLTLFDINAVKRQAMALSFAEAIMDTIREPLAVLDGDLRVSTVNRAFRDFFRVSPRETEGRRIYELGDGQWDMPRLRELLENVLTKEQRFEGFEVAHEFPGVGFRRMLLNARRLEGTESREAMILLAMEDVTEKRREKAE